jgi:RND family efflux transporter MFP subunit
MDPNSSLWMVSVMPQYLCQRRATLRGAGLLAACGFSLCAGLLTGCNSQGAAAVEPFAIPVTVSTPVEREVGDHDHFTGRTEAVESVEIRARVTGYLDKICFKEGTEVKRGDLLFEIDPRPFQAEYNRALSQVGLAKADLKFREAELNRVRQLFDKTVITQSELERTVAAHDQAAAAVAAAQASAERARLDLEFTKLTCPIDGEASRARITRGNLVRADDTLLTTVVSVDPMYVYFDIDERTILQLEQNIRQGKIKVQSGAQIPVGMGLATEKGFPHQGIIDFAENRVDPKTGTIRVRGVFANPKSAAGTRRLTPGLFTRVQVPIGYPYKALLVAERAVGTDQGQKYLYVVDAKNEVQYRRVKLGTLEGEMRVISEGLKPGERVIVRGLQRVRPGVTVQPTSVDMTSFDDLGSPGEKPAQGISPPAASTSTSKKS